MACPSKRTSEREYISHISRKEDNPPKLCSAWHRSSRAQFQLWLSAYKWEEFPSLFSRLFPSLIFSRLETLNNVKDSPQKRHNALILRPGRIWGDFSWRLRYTRAPCVEKTCRSKMSFATSLLHQTIAAFPLPPVDVADQAIKTVVLPNLSYPLRPSTYLPQRPRASDVLAIKRTTNFRYDADFAYSSGNTDVVDNSGRDGVLGACGPLRLQRIKVFILKNASKAMKKLKKIQAKLRRGLFL